MHKKHLAGVAVIAAAAISLAGCTGSTPSPSSSSSSKTLTVWTVEDDATRVAAQKKIMADYTKKTGVKVDLVALGEDDLSNVLASSVAAGKKPDVIGAISITGINQLATDNLVDTAAAADVIKSLGKDTFSQRALELTQSKSGAQLAVPSDGWAQLLFYRTDLFKKAGLKPPTTYAAIQKAAETLTKAGTAGIVASTAPADSFTQQTFEHFALANNCQLVNKSGKLTLNSSACQDSLGYYASLMKNDSVQGNQDADTTRATYFAGQAGMVVWSSFLLDELAGLRNDALPTCPECENDPGYLAANTGIVSAIKGPDGSEPASFGEIVSWAMLKGASPAAKDFVKYMMGDGYKNWLSIAPEGKVPTRTGTSDTPSEFTDAWKNMTVGVDKKELLSKAYPQSVLEAVVKSPNDFDRWGIPQGQGPLYAAVAGQFVIPQTLSSMINSGVNAKDGAAQAQQQAETIRSDLGQ